MATHFFINPDAIIELAIEGPQTTESMYAVIKDILPYVDSISSQGKIVKILVDVSKMTTLDSGAAEKAISGTAALPFDKSAIFGVTDANRGEIIQILNLSEKSDKSKIFETREEALNWLKS